MMIGTVLQFVLCYDWWNDLQSFIVHGEVNRMNELKKGLERDLIPENARLEVLFLLIDDYFFKLTGRYTCRTIDNLSHSHTTRLHT